MSPILVISLAVLIVIVFAVGAYFFLKQNSPQNARAREIVTGEKVGTKKDNINVADKRRAEIAKKLKSQDSEEGEDPSKKKKATLRNKLQQTGRELSVQQFFMYSAISSVVLIVFSLIMGWSILMIISMAVIGFFGIPRYVIGRMAKRRQKKFMEEFADSLEAMTRLLKSGMPVGEAIAMVAREYTGPIGEEMTRIYESQRIGVPLHEAAMEASYRMPLPEVRMFATGLAIQAQTGSSLSEILMNLSVTIRARYKLARKVKALSSEAKASAGIIGALPIVVGGGMYLLKPEHIMVMVDTPTGKVMLLGAVIWMGLGILSMKLMINFKV